MNDFESAAVITVVRGTMIGDDVARQLPYADVKERIHKPEGLTTIFAVEAEAPVIVPRNADLAADLVIAGVGQAEASVIVREGRLRALVVAVPPQDWPDEPAVLGRA